MLTLPLAVPSSFADDVLIVSVSGGKDSTATVLALREAGIPCRYVFADTGWEAPETYDYLALLESRLGITIARVGVPGGMVAMVRARVGFSWRQRRWCTRMLKLEPLQRHHDEVRAREDVETVAVVGVRADESNDRKDLPEWELCEGGHRTWDGYIWRPLIRAVVADVLALHHRHNIPVNPLYRVGFGRVGCMPCINATKAEVALYAQRYPQRVDELRELEREITAARALEPERFEMPVASFFEGAGRRGAVPIDEAVAWSRTARGGKQLPLIQQQPNSGCFRWGLCDPPTEETDGE